MSLLAQDALGVPRGTIRATVLIETISAHSRWTRFSTNCATTRPASTAAAGTTFSASSRTYARCAIILPDRAQVTMAVHFMTLRRLLIQTCHKRGIHAMGGMAPDSNQDDPRPTTSPSKGPQDKQREVNRARRHLGRPPGPDAGRQEVFDEMNGPNQIDKQAGSARSARPTC